MKFPLENLRRTAVWAIAIIVISTMMAMAVFWRAPTLNLTARDALVRARGTMEPADEVAIVAIDEASIKRFGRFPWSRSLTAQALDKISAARPKVIALNVLYSDQTNETDDATLAGSIKRAGNVVVAAQLVESPLRYSEWLRPLPTIEQSAAGTGHGNVLTDYDGVARALTLRESDDQGNAYWAMALEVLRVGDGLRSDEIRDAPEAVQIGSRQIPIETDAPTIAFSTQGQKDSPQIFRASRMTIDYIGPAGSFAEKTTSIADVIDGRIEPEKLNGRYVLIGATAAAMGDRVASPFGRFASENGDQHGTLMPGVELLANSLTTILRSRFYRETPDWIATIIAALVAAVVIGAISLAQGSYELARQVIALLGMIGLILGLSYFAFVQWMIAPPLVPAIISLATAAPLALLMRSLTVSASLDNRIAEMIRESARLSPLAILPHAGEAETEKPSWWPRGTFGKTRALAVLQNRLLARTQFVDRALLSVEDGLLIADLSGRIAYSNPRAAKIFGLTESSLLGSNLFDRLYTSEYGAGKPFNEQSERVKKETLSRLLNDRITIEREIVTCEAQPKYYTLRMAPVGDGKTQALFGVVATLADITKQRELQQMQSDVVTLVSHEMKTPLTAIKGMTEVLMKFEADPEQRRKMHATINEASERLTRMIDDYLDLTRLESGAHQLRAAFHRVESLIEQNLLLLDPVAAQRRIKLIRKFAPGSPPILVDADLLARALTNLVANAIKYSPADAEITVSIESDDKKVFIAVADHGRGISPEHRAHIFEKFFRAPSAENADTPGTGLGLALVREIAELHGGRVTVESEVNVGSTFTLLLPVMGSVDKVSEI